MASFVHGFFMTDFESIIIEGYIDHNSDEKVTKSHADVVFVYITLTHV